MVSRFTKWGAWLASFVILVLVAQATNPEGVHAQIVGYSANWSINHEGNAQAHEADKALEWMKSQQQADGSFAGFGAGSTVDAVLAIVAAGWDVSGYTSGGKTPVDFLQSKAAEIAKTPGGAGKLLIAVSAVGMDGRSFGGIDLLNVIGDNYSANGHYGNDVIGHAFAMLGLKAAGQTIPSKAMQYLESAQSADGGWAFSGDTKPGAADTNTTAVAVQALAAAGVHETDPAMQRARQYLLSQQNTPDGGFPYQKGGENGSDSDVNSTAYVVQALHYLGEPGNKGGAFILSMQKPSGAFRWKASEQDDNPGATYQAISAILGGTLVSPKGQNTGASDSGNMTPGMPRTGSGEALPGVEVATALIIFALCGGTLLRRKFGIRR